jgi:predicted subunit of tRNA(5-methylaminomethyl-2-thiouridylate) methyltransferase
MKKLIKLNKALESSLKMTITYNASIENYRYNNEWVTDLESSYFTKKAKKIEKLLDKNLDYNEKGQIKFVKQIFKNIKEYYKILLNSDYDDFTSFLDFHNSWDAELNFPQHLPQNSSFEINLPSPSNNLDDRQDYVLTFVNELNEYVKIKEKKEILEKIENESDEEVIADLTIKLKSLEDEDDSELNEYYPKAHLSYIISLHINLIQKIGIKLSDRIDVLKTIEGYEEIDNMDNSNSIFQTISPLNFNLAKKEVAHLFNSLYEVDVIQKDSTDTKNYRTKLKDFIDNSNIFYKDGESFEKVKLIGKSINWYDDDKNVKKDLNFEKQFIESIIAKLNSRIDKIQMRIEYLNKKNY